MSENIGNNGLNAIKNSKKEINDSLKRILRKNYLGIVLKPKIKKLIWKISLIKVNKKKNKIESLEY